MSKFVRSSPYSKISELSKSDHAINKIKTKGLRSLSCDSPYFKSFDYTTELSKLRVDIDTMPQRLRYNSSGSYTSTTESDEDQGIYFGALGKTKSSVQSPMPFSEKMLIIKGEKLTWEMLKAKLDMHSMLEELVILDTEITNIHMMDSKICLPHLKTFIFENSREAEFDWEEIFFFYTQESRRTWGISDIWSLGVNLRVSCQDFFLMCNKSESKLALSGRCVQNEFGNRGLSDFLQKLAKTTPQDFPKFISLGAHMVIKAIAYVEPVEIIELNLIDIKTKEGTINTMLKSIRGLKTFRYFSPVGDALEYNSLSPESIQEIHLNGISIDLFNVSPQKNSLSKLTHLWLTECWVGNGIDKDSIPTRFPQLQYLNLQGMKCGDENMILDSKYFPLVKNFNVIPSFIGNQSSSGLACTVFPIN